jgi:hypothetical protein
LVSEVEVPSGLDEYAEEEEVAVRAPSFHQDLPAISQDLEEAPCQEEEEEVEEVAVLAVLVVVGQLDEVLKSST